MSSLKVLNDSFKRYHENGLNAFQEKKWTLARNNFLLAAETSLKIAKISEPDLRNQRVETAKRLIVLSEDIYNNYLKNSNEKVLSESNNNIKTKREDDVLEGSFVPVTGISVKMDDVAGLEQVKKEIDDLIVKPMKYPDLYETFKINKGGGILLYGVPGTGKTMIAQAIATEIDAVFFEIKSSDIVSKWFGDSEKRIKELFETARSFERSIIFFDEFESLGTKRDTNSTVMRRLVPELLAQMQGFGNNKNTLIVIAATNRPWDIDSAFLRPGRFNTQILITLPDEDARRAIINSNFKDIPLDEEIDIEYAVIKTEGFNGSDVFELCTRVKREVATRIAKSRDSNINLDDVKQFVTNEDIETVLENLVSSVKPEDIELLEKYKEKYNLN